MALDTMVGSPTANSLATMEEIKTYLSTNYGEDPAFSIWDDLTVATQEDLAKLAALFFEYLPLRGDKVFVLPDYPEQAMPFPRTIQTDTTIIPQEIKDSQAEILFNIILRSYNSRTSPAEGSASNAQVKKLGLGGLLSIEFSEKGDNSGSIMEQFTRSVTGLTWLRMRPYITQMRGAVI